jgi:lyso-ornithine lipid O-acyltransferase
MQPETLRADQGTNRPRGPSHLKATVRASGLVGVTACLAVVQAVGLRLSLPFTRHLPRLWHRLCCGLLTIDVREAGHPAGDGPMLFICNHASYLDVPVLGTLIDARFVAKAEVARWPVIGMLSALQGTIFIERRPQGVRQQPDELRQALRDGANLVLFPEGTSSDGNRVLPFKSALFAAADAVVDGIEVRVQPVTIAYSRHRGVPMGRRLRPYFAWYGDMTLVSHLWTCLGLGGLGVDVVFHEPVRLSQFASRKELARHCQAQVARGLSDALSGRIVATRPAAEALGAVAQPGFPALPAWPSFALLETGPDL